MRKSCSRRSREQLQLFEYIPHMYKANKISTFFLFFTLNTSQYFQLHSPRLFVSLQHTPENIFEMIYYTWSKGSSFSFQKNLAFLQGSKGITVSARVVLCLRENIRPCVTQSSQQGVQYSLLMLNPRQLLPDIFQTFLWKEKRMSYTLFKQFSQKNGA